MTTLVFIRHANLLHVVLPSGAIFEFPACNNVDSHSKGPWPAGVFAFSWYHPMVGDPVESAYGSHGILIFDVPGREGTGLHAGRQGVQDGLGRVGIYHCTMGCIRTTEDAMACVLREHALNPIVSIEVCDV